MLTHLLPIEILEWERSGSLPVNALDIFIEKRVNLVIDDLQKKLPIQNFEVIDTSESTEG